LEIIQAQFLLLPSYRRFPPDDEFMKKFQTKDLYNFRSRSYWLRRLENHDRKERVSVDEYTIEHILPQSDNDPKKVPNHWREALGDEWERIWRDCRHTLGNLTLTGYNPELSDRSFVEKRDTKGGFRDSPLRLNRGLAGLSHWNEQTIQHRGAELALQGTEVWGAPRLEPAILEAYRPKAVPARYTIDDHPHLVAGPLREVFEAFRRQVLALDLCVTEEFTKLYVAYKAETNFVDVVPQAKRMRLSLNITFPEINDPKGMCKDVSGLGR